MEPPVELCCGVFDSSHKYNFAKAGSTWALVDPYGALMGQNGRSGHVRFPTFGRILHVLGSKLDFDEISK